MIGLYNDPTDNPITNSGNPQINARSSREPLLSDCDSRARSLFPCKLLQTHYKPPDPPWLHNIIHYPQRLPQRSYSRHATATQPPWISPLCHPALRLLCGKEAQHTQEANFIGDLLLLLLTSLTTIVVVSAVNLSMPSGSASALQRRSGDIDTRGVHLCRRRT